MTQLRVRRLSEAGLSRFQDFLDSHRGPSGGTPDGGSEGSPILTDPDCTLHVPQVVLADSARRFARRYDLAKYLGELVPQLGLSDPTRDVGLWAWLSLLWFDQLAPVAKGARKVGERAKWIPQAGWKYYRHLVLGPYLILASNQDCPERAMALLQGPPHTPGDLVGQLAATQSVAQSRAAISAATSLYYDSSTGTIRRGGGGSGPGSPRRLRAVLGQLDRTFDLHSLSPEGLLALLPKEFDRFKPR